MHRRSLLAACTAAAVATLCTPFAVLAQGPENWPSRPVRLIVPFPAGGTSDLMGRLIAEQLSKALKQPFIVENKGGAGGVIGTDQAAKAPADGYTLLLSGIGSNAIAHGMSPKPNYDSSKDFVHISQLESGPNVLVVNPSFPAKTFTEFVAYVKANPGKVNYGVTNASSGHLAMELLRQTAKLDMVGIPYRGGAPALTDVLAGQIPTMFVNQDAVLPYVKAGKLRALAVTSEQRNPLFPDVPTVAESGFPGFSAVSWVGLSAPKGTPQPIIDKLEATMMAAFKQPAVRQKLESNGFIVVASNSKDYTAFVTTETERWAKVIQSAGIKPE
ncbi:tripartite-type tricarboxylate transporter receptor subunit TctC [Cupriavidus gilardii J11]|uniref:Tripartite-type tricarboxylate transporter receptor subunit TctC n=1 Tax=Cupriavidus gilardii J11 TaxID=936133 RepID=A0A562B1E7_9BURK|nr:tripartite-type tricarboxylate transporter receptor subunit TctC [Cupriavidus gilardii J11]